MTTDTLTLSAFLTARIDQDTARGWYLHLPALDFEKTRAFRECMAKRQVVEWHTETADGGCSECSPRHVDEWPCRTLRALASVYASHPDFDPAWA